MAGSSQLRRRLPPAPTGLSADGGNAAVDGRPAAGNVLQRRMK